MAQPRDYTLLLHQTLCSEIPECNRREILRNPNDLVWQGNASEPGGNVTFTLGDFICYIFIKVTKQKVYICP